MQWSQRIGPTKEEATEEAKALGLRRRTEQGRRRPEPRVVILTFFVFLAFFWAGRARPAPRLGFAIKIWQTSSKKYFVRFRVCFRKPEQRKIMIFIDIFVSILQKRAKRKMQTKNTPTALKFLNFFCEFFLALYICKKCYVLGEAGPARICKNSFGKQLKNALSFFTIFKTTCKKQHFFRQKFLCLDFVVFMIICKKQ